MRKPIIVTSGEPAGIGPDLCLALARSELPIVILGDRHLLQQRAKELGLRINLIDYQSKTDLLTRPDSLAVLSISCSKPVITGKLNIANAQYVINLLNLAVEKCLTGEFAALVTAPVHKEVINQAGIDFTGHTEFLAEKCGVKTVIMMLACDVMKVALVTTHLPLRQVAGAISRSLIEEVISKLNNSLIQEFGITEPKIYVAGLNPHAGEGGYLGREEIEIITPALAVLREKGIRVYGPFPADTLFIPKHLSECDAFVAMYHDQGLPVLKYAGFGSAVNVTLGLPIIRTSVDHGTALELAGTGLADPASLLSAVKMAQQMVLKKD